jgi:probable HAF family extracellular repeat protein
MKKCVVSMRSTLFCACLFVPLYVSAAKDTFTASWVDRDFGENFFVGVAINNSGAVVGYVQLPEITYWYTGPNGKGTFYPKSDSINCLIECSITDINDQGQVVGTSGLYGATFAPRAYVTTPDGRVVDIHPAAATTSFSNGINARGQVVGAVTVIDRTRAFTSDRQNDRLRKLPTGQFESTATAINDRGMAAGCSVRDSGEDHAFVTGPNGKGITDLGTLRAGDSSCANDINAKGQVVGYSYPPRGPYNPRAFISTPDGLGMADLSQIGNPRGFTGITNAYGINRQGHVVGYGADASRGGQYAAFITGRNGVNMRNLNDLVTIPGYKIESAKAINDRGQILAEVVQDYPSLLLLTPTRPTWADELDDE